MQGGNTNERIIFVDESGNPGIKNTDGNYFVVSAVILESKTNSENLTKAIEKYLKTINWKQTFELKFHKTHKDTLLDVIRSTQKENYKIKVIIFDKENSKNTLKHLETEKSNYLYFISELLKIARSKELSNKVYIDGAYGNKHIRNASTYLRKSLHEAGVRHCKITFIDSKKSRLIQLADISAGSILVSLSKKKGAKHFKKAFGNKIDEIIED